METNKVCPSCQKPVTGDAPLGLCPECLIQSGFPSATGPEGGSGTGEGRSRFTPPPIEELSSLFPQLEITELIGRGGMGAVYKARQPLLDRWVALKILAREREDDPRFAERFQREARALAQMSHPNIVTVHDFGESGGLYYLVMEYVDGLNLRQLERTRRLAPEEALAIVPAICDALQYAHQQGIVHRDIKPENILLDRQGRVKIADFGIAKIVGVEGTGEPLTGDEQAIGTPHYMAPEQIEKPATVDRRADIYSLGVVFYEMLTGELPLGRFAPPSKKVQIDVRLDEVVLRALEKEPELRYQQAGDVKTEVEAITSTPREEIADDAARPDMMTWSPFQSAEVRAICVHMTGSEKADAARRGMFWGFWTAVTSFALAFAIFQMRQSGLWWLPLAGYLVVQALVISIWFRMQRQFLCSTEWARKQGVSCESLRLFSFGAKSGGDDDGPGGGWLRLLGQFVCFGGALFVFVAGFIRLSKMELGMTGLLAGVLLILIVTMLLVLLGILAFPSSMSGRRRLGNGSGVGSGSGGVPGEGRRSWLTRPLLSDDSLLRLGQFACFGGALFVFAVGFVRLSTLQLGEAELVGGVLLILILVLLMVMLGIAARPSTGSRGADAGTPPKGSGGGGERERTGRGDDSPRLSRTALAGLLGLMLPFVGLALNLRVLVLLGTLLCVIGTTILGWIAVSQIRRSGGRLYGMGLALFDGLLFPLLLLDVFIGGVLFLLVSVWTSAGGPEGGTPSYLFVALMTLIPAVAVDVWIVRAVWRRVKTPLDGTTGGAAPPLPRRRLRPSLAAVLLFLLPLLLLGGIGMLTVWRVEATQSGQSKRLVWSGGRNGFEQLKTPVPVRYRLFEADATLVDRLVPPDTRRRGDIPSEQELRESGARSGTPPNAVSQTAEISADGITSLTLQSAAAPELLIDHRRSIPWWPKVADSGAFAQPGGAVGTLGGFLGVRRRDGGMDLRVQQHLTHMSKGRRVAADLFYEGSAPPAGSARVFFVPFTGSDGAPRYLVAPYEVGGSVAAATGSAGSDSDPDLQVRFLAWQNGEPGEEHGPAWYPDGSPVTEPEALALLDRMAPPRPSARDFGTSRAVLNVWVSHPEVDSQTEMRVTTLDPQGRVIRSGSMGWSRSPEDAGDHSAWYVSSHPLPPGADPPATVSLRLRYGAGSWTEADCRLPATPGTHSCGEADTSARIGRDAQGNAQLTLLRNFNRTQDTQYDALAVAKDGRKYSGIGGRSREVVGATYKEPLDFPVPLDAVQEFRIHTRPIREVTVPEVALKPAP